MNAELDFTGGYLHVKASGEVSPQALLALADRYVSDPRFSIGMAVMWDMRAANPGPNMNGAGVKLASDHIRTRSQARKTAFLVSSGLGFGLSRMAVAFGEGDGRALQVFTSLSDAEAWLED